MSTAEIRNVAPYRAYIIRISFIFFLVILIWKYYSHVLPHQLNNPVLFSLGLDPLYILYYLSSISEVLTRENYSHVFSTLLFLSTIYPIINPNNHRFLIIYAILYLTYFIVFNTFLTFHAHYMSCILLLNLCFTIKENINFNLIWELMRYFICWVYSSAFIWKIINGSFFQSSFGLEIIKTSQASFIYSNPNNFWSSLYFFFLSNPVLTNLGTVFIFLLEALFLIGFFTKKIDGLLILSIFIIHLIIYLFVDTLFVEQCILSIALISTRTWQKIVKKQNRFLKISSRKNPPNIN
ncbi:hypothetical protein FYC62_08210 [Pedobacter aquae]|uniref:HTTM domain-containing protein n=1 Tax=Pedobacter aquae TaxID=2605747 RepID=A0A5C0VKY9_9SPHI|nr:hypothetical protein [Pedobacter aquae]QEK51644.1 hypothetical protein FYC62_08210 [Pedobacter aquae]